MPWIHLTKYPTGSIQLTFGKHPPGFDMPKGQRWGRSLRCYWMSQLVAPEHLQWDLERGRIFTFLHLGRFELCISNGYNQPN